MTKEKKESYKILWRGGGVGREQDVCLCLIKERGVVIVVNKEWYIKILANHGTHRKHKK